MKTGWIATSGDGSECGHHHKSYSGAAKCVRRQIWASRRDVSVEAREHGKNYREYVNNWVNDAVYYRGNDGNLHRKEC